MAKGIDAFVRGTTLREIARLIREDWTNIHPNAEPQVEAMEAIDALDDAYYAESGRLVVGHFLANAMSWRGETARIVRAELWSRIRTHDTRHRHRAPAPTARDATA